jgi:hypothetical protein
MVEAWFGIFTRKSVRRGSFDTVRALIRHIEAYIAEWNNHPTPFVWTKDPAALVKKALRRGRSHDFHRRNTWCPIRGTEMPLSPP